MSGTQKGSLKSKLGLKGKTKPGEMISRMNSMKSGSFNGAGRMSQIKKTGKSFGKSNKLGGGGRFRQVEHAVARKKGVHNPAGLAAYIGRKSLGKNKFQSLASKARASA